MSDEPSFTVARILDAFGQVPAHIGVVHGPDLVYVYVNDALARVLNIEEPIGKPFGSALHRTSEPLRRVLLGVLATGEPWRAPEVPLTGITPGVDTSYFNVNFLPVRDARGVVDGALIHSFDVTELVLARQAIAEKESRLRRLVEGNLVGIGFWGSGGAFTECNDELLRLLGAKPEDVTAGRATRSAMIAPEHATDAERVAKELATGGRFATFETELARLDGGRMPVMLGGAAFDPEATTGVVVALDLTERRRAEREHAALQAQLLHVQKLESLGVLAGGIAHDFNNMLAAVQGSISVAALMLPNESPAQRVLRDGLSAVRRAADLTRQLLAYSGKGHFQIERIDLSAHVRELAQLLETALPKKVQLRLELGARLPVIEADRAQIQQIVMNLVINGAEAIAEERGTVLVTTGAQDVDATYAAGLFAPGELPFGRYVFLEVHDTGSGMNQETQAKIFDPFFTTKFTGRGLGLAAVLGIVKAHRGAIKVYSALGHGTTFKVFFPAAEGAADHHPSASEEPHKGSGLVLVIDDDAWVRRVLRELLELFGYEVVEAGDGRRGVEAFQGRVSEFIFVVLDMTMPELSGEETFRELRGLRGDVPVILSSGYNEVEATRRFTTKGLGAFLPKPFTPDDLARCIRTALRKE